MGQDPIVRASISDDEVRRQVRRMRWKDRVTLVAGAIFFCFTFFACMAYAPENTKLFAVALTGVALVYAAVVIFFLRLRCPRCGAELQGSGHTFLGSLDCSKCYRCGAIFDLLRSDEPE